MKSFKVRRGGDGLNWHSTPNGLLNSSSLLTRRRIHKKAQKNARSCERARVGRGAGADQAAIAVLSVARSLVSHSYAGRVRNST